MMSWLDFFRNKPKKEERVERTDGATIQDLQPKLEIELKNIEERIQDITKRVRQRILQLNSELAERIQELKDINIEEKKVEEKLKFIVRENLNTYLSYLQKLVDNLGSLDYNDKDYFARIQSLFANFIRASANSFEKATILIGRELEAAAKSVKTFSYDINKMLGEERGVFEREKTASRLKALISSLAEQQNVELQIKNYLQSLEQNLKEYERKKEEAKKALENLKNSNEYVEEREKRNQEIEKSEKELIELRNEIDLKSLLKQFHHDRKKSQIIKEYNENFKEALENDDNLRIGSRIKEIKPEFDIERIREIKLRNSELKNWQEKPAERQLKGIEEEIKRLESEILDTQKEMGQEKKKEERFMEKTNQLSEEISKYARALWGQ